MLSSIIFRSILVIWNYVEITHCRYGIRSSEMCRIDSHLNWNAYTCMEYSAFFILIILCRWFSEKSYAAWMLYRNKVQTESFVVDYFLLNCLNNTRRKINGKWIQASKEMDQHSTVTNIYMKKMVMAEEKMTCTMVITVHVFGLTNKDQIEQSVGVRHIDSARCFFRPCFWRSWTSKIRLN